MAHGVAAPRKVVCSAESDVRFHVVVGDGSSVKVYCVVASGRSV
jgi:hypothetical protein